MIHWSVASELNSTNLLISHFYRYHKNCSRQEKNIVFNSISAFYDEVVSLKIIHFLFISFNWICVFEFAKRKFCVHRRKIQLTTHITHTHTHTHDTNTVLNAGWFEILCKVLACEWPLAIFFLFTFIIILRINATRSTHIFWVYFNRETTPSYRFIYITSNRGRGEATSKCSW